MVESDCEPSTNFKVVSWNINGIRTVKNLKQMLDEFQSDVICLQETKVTRDMIDEPTSLVEGYNAYFSFSRSRSGYSGVATYCKDRATPVCAEEGLSGILSPNNQSDIVGCLSDIEDEFSPQELKRLDSEGRTVITQHQIKRNGSDRTITIFNVYCPRADPEKPERLEYKLRFNRLLELRARAVSQTGSLVMIVGDINISHALIDRCENDDLDQFESNPARQWLNSFLLDASQMDQPTSSRDENMTSFKLIDSFRYFYPNVENAFTCWNTKINARSTNYGSRIDYILVDRELIQNMTDSLVLSEVQGSDHCPVAGDFKVEPLKATKCPAMCIKNFPEFSGVQQKLSAFFVKKSDASKDMPEEDDEIWKRKNPDNEVEDSTCKLVSKKQKLHRDPTQKQISSFFQKSSESVDESFVTSSQESKAGVSEVVSERCGAGGVDIGSSVERQEKSSSAASAWRSMLTGPRPPPLCKGHKEPCVERTVKKKGNNFNRKFYACARGEGSKTDPRARCDHFEWATKK